MSESPIDNTGPTEEPPRERGTRYFQISEPNLADLERILPELLDAMYPQVNTPRLRVQWRKVREIIADVRWNYGPPLKVIASPLGPDDELRTP